MAHRVPPVLPVPDRLRAAITAAFDPSAPALQHQDELVGLLGWIDSLTPPLDLAVVVEIGTHFGGTLACWAEVTARQPDPLVIAVDLPLGEGGPAEWGGMDRERTLDRNQAFELKYPHVRNVLGNSQHDSTIEAVRRLLAGRPVDLLFIDGDHTYVGVARDYINYNQFVRPGGVIAFHDVNQSIRAAQQNFAVPEFYSSIVRKHQISEIFTVNADWGGIGAVRA